MGSGSAGWGSPVALARHAPVAQAVDHLLIAEIPGLEIEGDGVCRLRECQAVVFPELTQTPSLLAYHSAQAS